MLDRRRITGACDAARTPGCVLEEMCRAHGVAPGTREQMLAALEATPCEHESSGLRFVARFVNADCAWRRAPLEAAYRHLTSFMGEVRGQAPLPAEFEPGPQTPDAPARANACVLYRVCLAYSLPTHTHTSLYDMAAMVRLLAHPLERLRADCLRFVSEAAEPGPLVQLLASLGACPSELGGASEMERLTREDLLTMHSQMHDEEVLRHSLRPSTCRGALVCAAVNFALDLSEFASPAHEYARLRGGPHSAFLPHDTRLRAIYADNSKYFSLSHTFKPLYPPVFYRGIAPALLEAYGLPPQPSRETAYEALLLESTRPTFYHGPLPPAAVGHQESAQSHTSIDFTPLHEVPYGQLFYYGVIGTHMLPITLEELLRFFTARSSFDCPLYPGTTFSSSSITRLLLMLYRAAPPSHRPLAPDTAALYAETYRALYTVRERLKDGPEFHAFFSLHGAEPSCRRAIELISEAGMYMRGWEGPGAPLPLRSAQTVTPPDLQPLIDLRANKAIIDLREGCAACPGLLDMPLFLFEHGKYKRSAEPRFGLSLGDRLDIVAQGNAGDNVHSCIRISSCWLLSTAAKYAATAGMQLPYRISDMDHIA